jgi:hypothetical protein
MTSWYHITTGLSGFPQPENNHGYLNKTYNSSQACPSCNIGLVQQNEFRFRTEPKSKHLHFFGLHWILDQVFISKVVMELFEQEQVTGITYSQPVLHKTEHPLDEWFQLRVDHLVSDGLITDLLQTEICEFPKDEKQVQFLLAIGSQLVKGPFCGRVKYHYPQSNVPLTIKALAFDNQPDIVRLDYYFGSGGNAYRPILISEKVKEIIEQEKWRGAFFQKINLV